MAENVPILKAASVLVIDDRPDLQVLVGRRRRSSGFVPGMIVFPGGAVDDEDGSAESRWLVPSAHVPGLDPDEAALFLRAGLRETLEEVGLWVGGSLPVDPTEFPHAGWWLTPDGAPRRYDTHFFLARYRGGEVAADNAELTEVWWDSPTRLLRRIDSGELDAIYPTIEFLKSLSGYTSVDEVLAAAGPEPVEHQQGGWVSF